MKNELNELYVIEYTAKDDNDWDPLLGEENTVFTDKEDAYSRGVEMFDAEVDFCLKNTADIEEDVAPGLFRVATYKRI